MAIAVSRRFVPSGDLPVEAGRYRLVASGACPWCRRVLIARRLLGLTEAIPVSWSYGKGADGYWELTGPDGEPGVDPALGARSLAEVYEKTPGYTPPPTVPALVDTTTGHYGDRDPDRVRQRVEALSRALDVTPVPLPAHRHPCRRGACRRQRGALGDLSGAQRTGDLA